ncbi:MAG: anaerobic ribonucleoside-triphosphate reductase activating protein [Clostridia bacterium]|nr:anaerobic ribonucleoside-triphosphate reductase activating protein [Clostridia bacterium]
MKINGLQKLTLLDFPGRTACTVFLAGCDFRCPFCHNYELTDSSADVVMESEELLEFLKGRVGRLDGVAFTGGEPTMRKDLPELLKDVKSLGFETKLDTNGNNPKALKLLLDQHLVDYVAMDVKNSPQLYPLTAGVEKINIDNITESLELLKNSGVDYELRTTVVDQLHNEESFKAIGPWIAGAPRYFLQAFADRETVPFQGFSAPSGEKMEEYARIVRPFVADVQLRGI